MRSFFVLGALAASSILTGCVHAAVVQPGHRGILFDPMNGLKHEVLPPGYYHLANGCKAMKCPRVDDFDVTYSTAKEQVRAHSTEGLGLDTHMAVIYRPVIAELFELDTEVGANYYDEVVGHEVRSAAIGVLARHSYTELRVHTREIEDEIEKEVRERIKGKHVEIDSITMQIDYAPEIEQAMRSKAVGEQDAARQKAFLENDALKKKLELEHSSEQARLKAETEAEQTKLTNEAELLGKQHELEMAKEQKPRSSKVSAEGDAVSRITRAKTQAEEEDETSREGAGGQEPSGRARRDPAHGPDARLRRAWPAWRQGDEHHAGRLVTRAQLSLPARGSTGHAPLRARVVLDVTLAAEPSAVTPAAVPIKTRIEDGAGLAPRFMPRRRCRRDGFGSGQDIEATRTTLVTHEGPRADRSLVPWASTASGRRRSITGTTSVSLCIAGAAGLTTKVSPGRRPALASTAQLRARGPCERRSVTREAVRDPPVVVDLEGDAAVGLLGEAREESVGLAHAGTPSDLRRHLRRDDAVLVGGQRSKRIEPCVSHGTRSSRSASRRVHRRKSRRDTNTPTTAITPPTIQPTTAPTGKIAWRTAPMIRAAARQCRRGAPTPRHGGDGARRSSPACHEGSRRWP